MIHVSDDTLFDCMTADPGAVSFQPPRSPFLPYYATTIEQWQYYRQILGRNAFYRPITSWTMSPSIQIQNDPSAPYIVSMNLSHLDHRFLLSAAIDRSRNSTSWSVYDLYKTEYTDSPSILPQQKTPLASTAHSNIQAKWYPVDNGIVVTCSGSEVNIWDVTAQECIWHVTPYQHYNNTTATHCSISDLALSTLPPFSVATCCSQSPYIRLLDLKSGTVAPTLTAPSQVTRLQWSPLCSHLLTSGHMDGKVLLWDVRQSGERAILCELSCDHRRRSTGDSCRFQPDYHHLVGEKLKKQKQRSRSVVVEPAHSGTCVSNLAFEGMQGRTLVSMSRSGDVRVWDISGGIPVHRPTTFVANAHGAPVTTPSRRQVPLLTVTSSSRHGNSPTLWIARDRILNGYSLNEGGIPQYSLQGHLGALMALCASSFSSRNWYAPRLFTAGREGMLLAWDTSSGDVSTSTSQPCKRRRMLQDQDDW